MTIRAYTFVIILVVLSAGKTLAQDRVMLKNGSVIYGKIIEFSEDDLRIAYDDGDELVLNSEQLSYVKIKGLKSREKDYDVELLRLINKRKFSKELVGMLDVGIVLSEDIDSDPRANFSASSVLLYRLTQFAQVGLGAGYDVYHEFESLPIYLYYRADISGRPSSPFVYGALGYGYVWDRSNLDAQADDITGGQHIRVGMGYQWKFARKSIYFTAGWKQQNLEYDNTPIWWDTINGSITLKRKLNRMELKVGLMF